MIGTWLAGVVAGAFAGLAWLGWRRGGMVAILVILALHALAQAHHVDDAGIVYAYAESIAGGHGLVPQPGGAVVEGISNPLWLLLLLPAALVGGDVGSFASVLQAAMMLGVVFLAGRLSIRVERTEGRSRPASPAAAPASDSTALARYEPPPAAPEDAKKTRKKAKHTGVVRLAVATSGVIFAWTSAGLEGALLALLLVVTAWAAAARLGPLTALAVLLCAWTRPEGAAAGLGVAAAGVALHGHWRALLWPVGASLLGLGSLHGVRWAALGTVFANSAAAKMGLPSWHLLVSGAKYAAEASFWSGWPLLALGWLRTRAPRPWLLPALIVLGTGLGLAVLSGGDWMRHGRYLAPYLPVLLAFALPPVAEAWSRHWLPRVGLVSFLLLGVGVLVDAVVRPTVPVDHGLRRGRLYAAVAAEACGSDDLSVATPDIGGVLWGWPQVRITDLAGLIDPDAAKNRFQSGYWESRLSADPPAILDLHDRWVRTTGLTADTVEGLGYRVLARRDGFAEEDPETPTLWLHARCDQALSARTQAMLEQWAERGSGQAWDLPAE